MEIAISERAKKFGYVFWTKRNDLAVEKFLKKVEAVEVWFNDSRLGKKKVDWRHRRISVGYKQTREMPDGAKVFSLKFSNNATLKIETI